MMCSGCGDRIPFLGKVCPRCQRDKAADKRAFIWAWIFAPFGAVIGAAVGAGDGYGIWGALIGAILAAAVAQAIWRPKTSKAPEVKPVADSFLPQSVPIVVGDVQRRLGELEGLRRSGLVSEAEYATKRQSILDTL